MRRMLAVFVLLLGGCGTDDTGTVVTEDVAGIYVAAIRAYLTSPPVTGYYESAKIQLRSVYVLDHTDAQAADEQRPVGPATPTPIGKADQERITAAFPGLPSVTFVATRDEVMPDPRPTPTPPGPVCKAVKDDAMLITLTPPVGDARKSRVGLQSFMTCLSGNGLIYKLERADAGWRVTGIDGSIRTF